ncbi:MAG TPA: DNA gyrase C-terminal beta-propeller domain-containing protein, partial [Bacilli bacterium]|nr:DNA gyrase C-terminal beta-propeller domain-containing protein [Bacilli bacterium]
TTLDNILLFTNQGRYLFIPVHTILETKWREIGKHVSNLVLIAPTEKIIGSLVIDNPQTPIIMYTQKGYVKQSLIQDYIVSRYSKPMTAINLKAGDELISVQPATSNSLLVTQNGYYLQFNNQEIPLMGVRASGVKGINLKDDLLVAGLVINQIDDITIFTNNKTAKRIHVNELSMMSRAKKGSLILKKVKSVNYQIIKVLKTDSKTIFKLKKDEQFTELKASEIPLMDALSTGSIITKHKIDDVLIDWELTSYIKQTPSEKPKITEKEPELMTIDDFIDDFRL